MPRIEVDFDNVPDEYQQVEPGIYVCVVVEAGLEETKKGDSQKTVLKLRVDDENSKFHGRHIYDHIGMKQPISLKQCIRSCGLEPTKGFDLDTLIGKHCRVRVKGRTYKDQESGEQKETVSVAEYLFKE